MQCFPKWKKYMKVHKFKTNSFNLFMSDIDMKCQERMLAVVVSNISIQKTL